MATSQDDFVVSRQVRAFYNALLDAGHNTGGHFYPNDMHGYGMNETNSSSRHFIEQVYCWLQKLGLTQKPGDADRTWVSPDLRACKRQYGSWGWE